MLCDGLVMTSEESPSTNPGLSEQGPSVLIENVFLRKYLGRGLSADEGECLVWAES
jgi:hypothetical protein